MKVLTCLACYRKVHSARRPKGHQLLVHLPLKLIGSQRPRIGGAAAIGKSSTRADATAVYFLFQFLTAALREKNAASGIKQRSFRYSTRLTS